jgi:NADH dehydrogenase
MGDAYRVVILGGGFGGLNAAKALKSAPAQVTLVDRRNFHLFQPLMYQIATGSLSPAEIAAPLRTVLRSQKNTQVWLGEAVDVDPALRHLVLRDEVVLEYDALIVAAGSRTNYYGRDEWRECAPSLKTVEEATAIRRKILFAFEAAERTTDPDERRAWLTFAIIGAGATGVELAGAIAEIARHTLRGEFRSIRPEEAQVLLLDSSPRVLPTYPEDLSAKAEHSLVKLGARSRTGVKVTAIDREGITFEGPRGSERLPTRTVLWAGGVTATEFGKVLAARTGAQTDRSGKIHVQPDLTIPGYPDIFVVGDLALAYRDGNQPLPGVAQVAMQQGTYAARAVVRRIEGQPAPPPFHYFDKGDLAVIGRASAVARIFGVHLSGWPAWVVWLFVHLMYLVQFQSRILVFIQWGFLYLTFSRGARLITGPNTGCEK